MVVEESRRVERRLRQFGHAAVSVEGRVVERADPAVAVLENQKEQIDLVVVGSSGKTGMASVLGSVTRRVVRKCPCPVLVLPTTNRVSARDVWRKSRLL